MLHPQIIQRNVQPSISDVTCPDRQSHADCSPTSRCNRVSKCHAACKIDGVCDRESLTAGVVAGPYGQIIIYQPSCHGDLQNKAADTHRSQRRLASKVKKANLRAARRWHSRWRNAREELKRPCLNHRMGAPAGRWGLLSTSGPTYRRSAFQRSPSAMCHMDCETFLGCLVIVDENS